MTQDKCVYTVQTVTIEAREEIQNHIEESNDDDDFSAEIIDTDVDGHKAVFEIEVHGDAYVIPLFEERLSEIESVEVLDADVDIGGSKFA